MKPLDHSNYIGADDKEKRSREASEKSDGPVTAQHHMLSKHIFTAEIRQKKGLFKEF
jgi:hypothetical protein